MRKITGTIIKLADDKAAIMTRDCEVLYIRKQLGMYRGLEIQFGSNEIISGRNKINLALKSASSIAAIFLIIFIGMHLFSSGDTYAYVGIDGKTNIEFAVDSRMKVVKASSFDEKTQNMLMEMDLKSKPLEAALAEVLKKTDSIAQEDINNDCILISAYLKDGVSGESNKTSLKVEEILKVCKNSVDKLDDNGMNFKLVGIKPESRKTALENNISIGRYYLFEKAKEQGVNISIDEAKGKKVGEFVKDVKIEELLPVNEEKTQKKEKKKADIKGKPDEKTDSKAPSDNVIKEVEPKKEGLSTEKMKKEHKDAMKSIGPKAPDVKNQMAPIIPKVPDGKREAPIDPKAPDIKNKTAPIAPKEHDRKKQEAPIEPKSPGAKKEKAPIIPKPPEDKKEAAPIAPKPPEDKKEAAPIAPKPHEAKQEAAPIEPKAPEDKKEAAPIAPKPHEAKQEAAPMVPKPPETRSEAAPIPPKPQEAKK